MMYTQRDRLLLAEDLHKNVLSLDRLYPNKVIALTIPDAVTRGLVADNHG